MGEKIFHFFKRVFGGRAEQQRKLALLEINYDLLKEQYESLKDKVEELTKKVDEMQTASSTIQDDKDQPSPRQILDEWLNGGKE